MKMLNNKGEVPQLIIGVVTIFAGAVFLVLMYYMMHQMIPPIQAGIPNITTTANESLQTGLNVSNSFDAFVLVLMIAEIIALIAVAFIALAHPAFIPVYIILWLISILVSIPLSNAYQYLVDDLGVGSSFTMSGFILTNFPAVITVLGVIFIIVLFAKNSMRSNL